MKNVLHTAQQFIKSNSPTILSSTAIAGVATTAYLSGRAAIRARDKIRAYQNERSFTESRKQRIINDAKLTWKIYIPAAASGVVTIVCIAGANRVWSTRATAAQAAFIVSERAFQEYRAKVVEEYGERKDQTLRDSVAADRVSANPPPESLIVASGSVICCELHTGRYFASSMETLRRAENDFNSRLLRHDTATLDDWYYAIGVPGTTTSGDLGWNSDKLLSLEFTSVLDDQGRPCLAFSYEPNPRPIYGSLEKGW